MKTKIRMIRWCALLSVLIIAALMFEGYAETAQSEKMAELSADQMQTDGTETFGEYYAVSKRMETLETTLYIAITACSIVALADLIITKIKGE